MSKSTFFEGLMSKINPKSGSYHLRDILAADNMKATSNFITYQILINFLYSDLLVIPQNISEQTLVDLARLADYFCLLKLKNLV